MKQLMAQLDAACAWVNPGLVIVAVILVILDVAAAGQRWTLAHPPTSVTARTVVVTAKSEQCAPALPPELREMAGRD
jgi:hypothetical protein